MKSKDVLEQITAEGYQLEVNSSGIELGKINTEKVLYLSDKDVSELIYNLIEYALLREEVRRAKNK